MSEIYNKPIEIYAYHSEPMRTFHEDFLKLENSKKPIRLSYHGKEHYNSIRDFKSKEEEEKLEIEPGVFE
jgi:OTU domain-containing protein 5